MPSPLKSKVPLFFFFIRQATFAHVFPQISLNLIAIDTTKKKAIGGQIKTTINWSVFLNYYIWNTCYITQVNEHIVCFPHNQQHCHLRHKLKLYWCLMKCLEVTFKRKKTLVLQVYLIINSKQNKDIKAFLVNYRKCNFKSDCWCIKCALTAPDTTWTSWGIGLWTDSDRDVKSLIQSNMSI